MILRILIGILKVKQVMSMLPKSVLARGKAITEDAIEQVKSTEPRTKPYV